jgi:VWFA-related protein
MLLRVAIGFLLTSVLTLAAQQPPAAPPAGQETARFGTATAGVIVDAVARDKRGRPVTDLSPTEFEIYEDGVRQQIVAFEPYTPEDGPKTVVEAARVAGVGTGKATTRRLSEGPPVIALAWDRLEPEGRALAHQAAKRLVETKAPGELVGVFLTDMTLRTIEPYTTDSRKLSAAVELLATTATSALTREPSPLDHMIGRAQTSPTASAADGGFGLAGFPQSPANTDGETGAPAGGGWPGLIAMLKRMERTYMQFLYEAQGRASMIGLQALVDSLGDLPGRKTVLYFCEGLTITSGQEARFKAIIDTANRNNVSVYTFDSAGLRVHSSQQQTAREIRELTPAALGNLDLSEKLNENLENNERILKLDPAVSLGILADQTGGLLSNNTNALDRAIDRINDDRRHHYLLSYVSTNTALDGRYRKIEVKSTRRNVEVRARRGYRAVAAPTTPPVLGYEAPALAALAATSPPLSFPILARALSTPMPGRPGLTAVIVGFSASSLAVGRNKEGTSYFAEATAMARMVDSDKRELARASQQYQFTGELDKQQASMARDVLFFRTPELPAGRHTMEAVVHDGIGEKSTVLRIPVEIAAASDETSIGDLFVVSRVEPFPGDQPGAGLHPLVWKGVLVYPSFGEPVSKARQREVTFALPMVVVGETPVATLQQRRGAHTLAMVPLPAETPLPGGRLMLVGRLPLDQIPPGVYDLQVTVTGGGRPTTRSAGVTVVE